METTPMSVRRTSPPLDRKRRSGIRTVASTRSPEGRAVSTGLFAGFHDIEMYLWGLFKIDHVCKSCRRAGVFSYEAQYDKLKWNP
jgi:hypothetical protein